MNKRQSGFALGAVAAILGAIAAAAPTPASAQELVERYTARLSSADHFSSRGERLTTAAGILRQDRANVHRFGVRDDEDGGDGFFESQNNRDIMERLLLNGSTSPAARDAIVNGTPLVRVSIWRYRGIKDYVDVQVLQ